MPANNPWVDLATQGWLTGDQAPLPVASADLGFLPRQDPASDPYYSETVPELHGLYGQQGRQRDGWLQQVFNALGVVGPHLQNMPASQVPHGPDAPARSATWRGTGQRWQSPQARPLADWTEGRRGLYPRFYGPGGGYAEGGEVRPAEQYGSAESPHMFRGPGGGQDDQLNAKVSPGEYIFSAMDVAALGDGDNEEGARRLDDMRGALRQHLMNNGDGHPPKARGPLSYLREAA